jgi:hypothetical protein
MLLEVAVAGTHRRDSNADMKGKDRSAVWSGDVNGRGWVSGGSEMFPVAESSRHGKGTVEFRVRRWLEAPLNLSRRVRLHGFSTAEE